MKKVGKPVFFIITILTLALVLLSVIGIHTMFGDIKTTRIKGIEDVIWGRQMGTGVKVTFTPYDDETTPTQEELEKIKTVLEKRFLAKGITDFSAVVDMENRGVAAEFPWTGSTDAPAFDTLMEEVCAVGQLTFREGFKYDEQDYTPVGITAESMLFNETHIKSAKPSTDSQGNNMVKVALHKESHPVLQEITSTIRYYQEPYISVWLDDAVVSVITVSTTITDGTMLLPGSPTPQLAKELAAVINAGPLPYSMVVELDAIFPTEPSLGAGFKTIMLAIGAGIIALGALLLLLRYRVTGLSAAVSLVGQGAILVAGLTGFFPDVTPPTTVLTAFIGIYLALLLGIVTHFIIGKRVKASLEKGKSVDSAITAGYANHVKTFLLPTLVLIIISGIVLAVTTGSIYSLALYLLIGVIASYVFNVIISRFLLLSLASNMNLREPKHYGAKDIDN